MLTPSQIFLALLAVNAWTILRFWQDKQRAIGGEKRIPERDLLGLALIGGSAGAMLARRWFSHKTRKEPFSSYLVTIAVLQAAVVFGITVAFAWSY